MRNTIPGYQVHVQRDIEIIARNSMVRQEPNYFRCLLTRWDSGVSAKRWVIRRKAQVVAAVRGGLLTVEEACARYMLTVDELLSWQSSIDQHGLPGLRTTPIQQYSQ
jgi:hypothetical protein